MLYDRHHRLSTLKIETRLGELALQITVQLFFKIDLTPQPISLKTKRCRLGVLVSFQKLCETLFCVLKFSFSLLQSSLDEPQPFSDFFRLNLSDPYSQVLNEALGEF